MIKSNLINLFYFMWDSSDNLFEDKVIESYQNAQALGYEIRVGIG